MIQLKSTLLALSCLVMLSSCASHSGTGWPATTYFDVCDLPRSEPMAPGCLYGYRQFYSQSEFYACQQSVENYTQALQNWKECAIDYTNNRFLDYAKRAKETISCLERELPNEYTADRFPNTCEPVTADIDMLQILDSFKVYPMCISKKEYFPKYKQEYGFERCKQEVGSYNSFMRDNINDSSWNLHSDLQFKADDAVSRFNSRARQ